MIAGKDARHARSASTGLCRLRNRAQRIKQPNIRVRPFLKFFRHNAVLIDLSELSTRISIFIYLDNVYPYL